MCVFICFCVLHGSRRWFMNPVHVVMIVASGMASPSISRWRPALLDAGGRHLGSWGAPETRPGLRLFGQDKGWFLGHKNYIKPTIHTCIMYIYRKYIYIYVYTHQKLNHTHLFPRTSNELLGCLIVHTLYLMYCTYIYRYTFHGWIHGHMDGWSVRDGWMHGWMEAAHCGLNLIPSMDQ